VKTGYVVGFYTGRLSRFSAELNEDFYARDFKYNWQAANTC